jgi:DNA-binding Xre family transcriptional regulator
MRAVPVNWTIRQLLQRHAITPYRLMKESGLAQGTIYRLVNGDTRSLNADTLDRVMTALRRLTSEDIAISDLLEYEEPKP